MSISYVPICSFNGTHNHTQPPEPSGLVLVIHGGDHFSFLNSSIHTSNESVGAVKLSQFNQILCLHRLQNLSETLAMRFILCVSELADFWWSGSISLGGSDRTELYNQLRSGRGSVVHLGHHLKCMTVYLS